MQVAVQVEVRTAQERADGAEQALQPPHSAERLHSFVVIMTSIHFFWIWIYSLYNFCKYGTTDYVDWVIYKSTRGSSPCHLLCLIPTPLRT